MREFAEGLPEITVDRHKVVQILVNLIRNAKHACNEAHREDKQLTLRLSNGAGRIKFSVSDNGVGIPPENFTRIFSQVSPRAATVTASACTAGRWRRRRWAGN